MLKLGNKEVIGIDIGTHAVKAVQLKRAKGHWSVCSAAIAEISEKHADSPSRREANTGRSSIPTRNSMAEAISATAASRWLPIPCRG